MSNNILIKRTMYAHKSASDVAYGAEGQEKALRVSIAQPVDTNIILAEIRYWVRVPPSEGETRATWVPSSGIVIPLSMIPVLRKAFDLIESDYPKEVGGKNDSGEAE